MIYACAILLYSFAIHIAARCGNVKAKQWVQGRKHLFEILSNQLHPSEKRIWVHCASLGEFEQGRPLIEDLRQQHPSCKIVLTFYSPSGFEIRKNYPGADYICYLPSDTPSHAKRFVELIQPEKVFFIKYEFWRNYLFTLKRKNIPVYLVSANFRSDQLFFKSYGGWYRRVLHTFRHIFVQNERSKALLQQIGITDVTVTGDTRFDRVCRIAEQVKPIPALERFLQGTPSAPCIIAGSSWPPDEALLTRYLNESSHPIKWIFAPHEIHDSHVQKILDSIQKKVIRFSKITDETDMAIYDAVVMDNMGMLSSVYQYGKIAYIGGGFGKGIHNTLEAAVFGMPVLFGPHYKPFQEAIDLVQVSGAFPITSYEDLRDQLDRLLSQPGICQTAGRTAAEFVASGKGATQTVLKKAFSCLALCLFLTGCSTQRNTPISRTYHSITTQYNVLFNGEESFKSGLKAIAEAHREDYTQLIPLTPYEDKEAVLSGVDNLETAILKAGNAITLHSIKAKPHMDPSRMNTEQERFYNRNEFNPFIDDCYLLMGKSYYYLQDYYNAIKTFDRIAEIYPRDKVIYTAEIWRIKTRIAEQDYEGASRLLEDLKNSRELPTLPSFRTDLQLVEADLLLHLSRLEEAAQILLPLSTHRAIPSDLRSRMKYLLAQIYHEQGAYDKSIEQYHKVIHSPGSYAMKFQAQLSLATVSAQHSKASREQVKADLQRMLKSSRNASRLHQIYYTLAEITAAEGPLEQAIPYYQQATLHSLKEDPLRAKTTTVLADFFYTQKDYATAASYYDSTMMCIDAGYPNYATYAKRASVLKSLNLQLNLIQTEDSLQRIAALPEEDRTKLIEQIIQDITQKEALEKEAEQLRMSQYYSMQSRQSGNTDMGANSSNWYFYNTTSLSRGADEFTLRWGKRSLEDDWRRKDHSVVVRTDQKALAFDTEEEPTDTTELITDIKDPQFYLQDLPLTDSLLAISHQKIADALYSSANLYLLQLEEPALAATQWETLLRRYPQTDNALTSYYALYQIYLAQNETSQMERCKSMILEIAPESMYAKIISDPSYLSRMEQQRIQAEALYQEAFQKYEERLDEEVIALADRAFSQFPEDLSLPQFAYLRALSKSRQSANLNVLRTEMQQVISDYPRSEVARAAEQQISTFSDWQAEDLLPTTAFLEETGSASYVADEAQTHAFGWYLTGQEDLNQLTFDLLNFNLDHYPNIPIAIEKIEMSQNAHILLVSPFRKLSNAIQYYQLFNETTELQANVKGPTEAFIISMPNVEVLKENKTINAYLRFFRANYTLP